jgi:hypothetical protein
MAEAALGRTHRRRMTDAALSTSAAFWLLVALIGQWAFFYYIAAFYGGSILAGQPEIWNRLEAMGAATPYRPGDAVGNATFAAHALGAGVVALGGALQLIPFVRRCWPVFHRWNGRVFLLTVTVLSFTGFYLVFVRKAPPDTLAEWATPVNGVLILAFAALTLQLAMQRNIAAHQRWAMRLYLVSNAQWFIRVGFFAYFIVSTLIGHEPDFSDPFFPFWSWGCFLVPLTVLQLYFFAQDSGNPAARVAMSTGLVLLTLVMGAGMFAFALFSQRLITGAPIGPA